MRISSNTIYEAGTANLSDLQTNIAKTQQQLSTGRRMLTAADDPIAASRALEISQSDSINTQYATNRQNANSSLSQVEIALQGATTLLQDVKTLAINGGNGILTPADRASLATELSAKLDDLIGIGNTVDGSGHYLFGGFKTSIQPFVKTATGATYQGDQGERELQVSSSRQVPMSATGNSVFELNKTGNGTFATSPTANLPLNTGSGIISSGSVTDATQLTGHGYDISFTVALGVTTFDVVDSTTGVAVVIPPAVVAGPTPYVSGQTIAFDGLQFNVTGSPADTDKFAIVPSTNQSIFTTLTNLINTLKTAGTGATGQAALTNGLFAAYDNLDKSLDNVLSVRATVGSNLKELETLDNTGADLGVQYKSTLSELQDLDYVEAISRFSRQQTSLEAAQKSYIKVAGLSLFNYIS